MHGLGEIVRMNDDRAAAEYYRNKLKEFYQRLARYEDVVEVLVDMKEALRNG